LKTLPKCITTKTTGVSYKEIISKNNKVIDKKFLIRYIDENNNSLLMSLQKNILLINQTQLKMRKKKERNISTTLNKR